MKRDSRLSGVLHVLIHLLEQSHPVTSDALAKMLKTHPVVVRRILAGLRERGFVQSEKGHGGGWKAAGDLSNVTLFDIYLAIGQPALLAVGHRDPSARCLVEQSVNARLGGAYQEAEEQLLTRLREVTLSMLIADCRKGLVARLKTKRGGKSLHGC